MYLRAVRLARLFRNDLFRFHVRNALVDPADRLEFLHGLDVHDDLCIRDIEQLRAPCVLHAQRIVRHREDGRFHSVYRIFICLERHFLRFYPFNEFLVRKVFDLALVEIAGITVFQKHRRFPFVQQLCI